MIKEIRDSLNVAAPEAKVECLPERLPEIHHHQPLPRAYLTYP
jgi:hypothetical protein